MNSKAKSILTKIKQYASLHKKVLIYKLAAHWFKTNFLITNWIGAASRYIGLCAGTIIGLLATSFLYTPYAQNILGKYENLYPAFMAIGGIIGTMLALVLSLSIIPIQRATEVFTPSIINAYKTDRVTLFIFSLLILFCVGSFTFGVDGITGVPTSKVFPLAILCLATSLDLLRWHHRRVTALLTSDFAVKRILKVSTAYIRKLHRQITKLARIQFRLLPDEKQNEQSQELLQSAIYQAHPHHMEILKHQSDEIAEIIHKAIAREETNTAKSGITALVSIANSYLRSRKTNLMLIPSEQALFLVFESDVDSVLTTIYEHLQV